MAKITLRLGIFCLFIWKTVALRTMGHCENINDYTQFIDNYENGCHCYNMGVEGLADGLSTLMKYEAKNSRPIKLLLTNIEFNGKNGDKVSKMKKGWLNIEQVLVNSLQLDKIQISEIEDDSFSSSTFQPLEYLHISNVPLQKLNKGTFNGLEKLTTLHMRGLRLGVIEKNVFAPIPNLQTFHLIDCGPEKIWLDNLFGGAEMRHLILIHVNNCNLNDTITEKTFSSISRIRKINLSFTFIEKIASKSFDVALKTLERLFLTNNKLKTVPENLFKSNRNVYIQLNSNPWHCGCELEHLRLFQQKAKNVNVDSFICQTPRKFSKTYLKKCTTLCEEMTSSIPIFESTTNIPEKESSIQQPVESISMDLLELIASANDELVEFIESTDTTESTVEPSDEENTYIKAISIPICLLFAFLIGILVLIILSNKFELDN